MARHGDYGSPLVQPLTSREQEILNCLGDSMTNRQIATHLVISLNTVKWYVRQIYGKLGVDNRTTAVDRARRLGLLPAAEQANQVRNNLPVAATPFVGRQQELAALAELIADPHVRIITIVGPGGIGKTRLSLETARLKILPQPLLPDGIFFVSLAPLESAVEIVPALATVLDFHFQGSGNEREQLLNYLRQKRMLLIMDNFEHLLDGRSFLAEMSSEAADIKLLVTSRERLQLRGEQLFPLHGLEVSQTDESLDENPAARLFLNIAKRNAPDFQLLEGDAGYLLRICQLVEGMPLGLELAASWSGLLPLSRIAMEIEQSLDLLAVEHHDAPSRHQSMQAALDTSWIRLTTEQRRSFKELTVFRGGFTRKAALVVAGVTLPLLVTLVNKSWLTYDRESDRYHIHELLRQYGAAKLSADPLQEQMQQMKHSTYFCGLLQEIEADWYGPRQKEAASEVRGEIGNIQRAWHWAVDEGNCLLLDEGLDSLCRFFLWEGRKYDGAIACRSAATSLSKRIADPASADGQLLALWSHILAWESDFVVEIDQKEILLTQSHQLLDLAAQNGQDTRSERAFLYLMRSYAMVNKNYEKTIEAGLRALELYRELGDSWGEGEILAILGDRNTFLGRFRQASEYLQQSLKIRQQQGDIWGIAKTTGSLGILAQHQGHYEEAEDLHRQAYVIYEQLGNQFFTSYSLVVHSFTQSWAGRFASAKETAVQSLKLGCDLGDYPNLWSLTALTTAIIHLGEYSETVANAQQILAIAQKRGHQAEEAFALMFLGQVAFLEGDIPKANHYLQQSAERFAGMRYVYQSLPSSILAYTSRLQGDIKRANRYLESALRSGIESQSTTPIMYCLPAAALLAANDGQTDRAVELLGLGRQFMHLANSRWFEAVAFQELEEVRTSLNPDVANAAEATGKEMDLWQTAEILLTELAV